ncbi:putative mitochondrial protein [Vitis vinifera]|uniref:Putative mitochondrial protein n=1 Tax=Vitis vinifera TaxID=29760 RepID=A0A438J9B8_VITVI|nr:putative mitochondrial protein [Vitis vinifera]
MEWIWWCISTAKFSVMINGVPVGFFSNSKGLRQGDLLSPYLFVLGMEVLSNLIRRAVDGGFLSGCRIRGRGEEEMIVSHLLFADDTIIFCEARKEQLSALSWILAWFEAASGLRINLDKNVLIPVGEVEDIEEMVVELGCKVGLLPTVYLGLPLGAHHKVVSMWDGVEERMRKRLAQWKRQYISKGGRITLIKSTMASLPIYNILERKVYLIKWEVVCTQKEKGGLGIRKIDPLNKALLEFGWRTKEARGTYGVGIWKEILKEAKWCWDNIKFKLFELAVHRNATINEMWDPSMGQGGWNLRFHRDFNDWELDLIRGLLNRLRDFRITSEEDAVLWKEGSHGKCGVKVAYNVLTVINACAFPTKCVWVDKVPTKTAFFAWEAAWGKILTLDRLLKRGWQLPNRYFLCGCEEENEAWVADLWEGLGAGAIGFCASLSTLMIGSWMLLGSFSPHC